MDRDNGGSSSARKWWLLVGSAVVFVVGFTLLERIVPGKPRPSPPTEEASGIFSPGVPQVRRLDDGGIEIRHDLFRRTTIRIGEEDAERALFDCLEQGIEETFGEGVEGWDDARIRRETRRIQDECMVTHGVALPVPPPLPGADRRP